MPFTSNGWRPQLRDTADDMVLEAAVNGRTGTIIPFDERDFLPQALSFDLVVLKPEQFFRGK
jgi:predicted nucleic acid-binding protein